MYSVILHNIHPLLKIDAVECLASGSADAHCTEAQLKLEALLNPDVRSSAHLTRLSSMHGALRIVCQEFQSSFLSRRNVHESNVPDFLIIRDWSLTFEQFAD